MISSINTSSISVVGLGKLGLCLAGCLADKGFQVIGVDIEEQVVNHVNQGKAPWFEPGLDELLLKHGGKTLKATLDHSEAINNTDITFILVATPSTPDGSFSNRFIESTLISLGEALSKSKKDHHLFIISSTVLPESTDKVFIPLLEKVTGRELNKGFSVCYDPDFVALGNVIKGFLQPDLVIIGESSAEAGGIVEAIHRQMCENTPVISRMSIINAELAKVCLNTYITVKISFANSIANLCEKVPGADVDSITKAIGIDRRISPYYFQGGLAFGGTCFPRDVKAFITLAEKYGAQAELIRAVEKINKHQNQHLVEIVLRQLERLPNKTVGIIGLAFTNNTPVITESPAIKLIDELIKHDIRVVAYDPLAIDNTRNIFGSQVEYVHSVESCLAHVSLAVITLRNLHIKEALENFAAKNPITIIDCWRMIDANKLDKTLIKYVPIGRYFEEDY
jgi:UDPglucose 6-dehydrogenase